MRKPIKVATLKDLHTRAIRDAVGPKASFYLERFPSYGHRDTYMLRSYYTGHRTVLRSELVLGGDIATTIIEKWRRNSRGEPIGVMSLRGICQQFFNMDLRADIRDYEAEQRALAATRRKFTTTTTLVDRIGALFDFMADGYNEHVAAPMSQDLINELSRCLEANRAYINGTPKGSNP